MHRLSGSRGCFRVWPDSYGAAERVFREQVALEAVLEEHHLYWFSGILAQRQAWPRCLDGGRASLLRALFVSRKSETLPVLSVLWMCSFLPTYFFKTQEGPGNEGNVLSWSPPGVVESGAMQGPLTGFIMACLWPSGFP